VDFNPNWHFRKAYSERERPSTTRMAIPAVKGLLEKTGTNPEDVDLLIFATVTPDMQFPASANI
jgi:3-oxoacyl-[acyl-carrier-protein] synthase-3